MRQVRTLQVLLWSLIVVLATTAIVLAHLYATTGDQDDAHARIEWSTLLPAANAALGKAGL